MMGITSLATFAFNLTQQDTTQAIILWVMLSYFLIRRFVFEKFNRKFDLTGLFSRKKLELAQKIVNKEQEKTQTVK